MNTKSKAYGCLVFICVVWGTTYLFTRMAVVSFPAFIFAGIRNVSAGLVLLLILAFSKRTFVWKWSNILPNAIAGMLIVGLGTGLMTWSVKFIPSGLASLICTLTPLNIIVLSLFMSRSNKLNGQILIGIISGTLGMCFIFRDHILELSEPQYFIGVLIALFATLCWSVGTLYSRTKTAHTDIFYNSAVQLLAGGVLSLFIGTWNNEWSGMGAITNESLLALLYLTLVGSVAAFSAYQFALSTLPVGLVVVYAYVNPLIAVLLGYTVLSEKMTVLTCIAFVLTIAGVYMVNKGYQLKKLPVS
jgi:drug/metabolite transporter (DMT)-like permease